MSLRLYSLNSIVPSRGSGLFYFYENFSPSLSSLGTHLQQHGARFVRRRRRRSARRSRGFSLCAFPPRKSLSRVSKLSLSRGDPRFSSLFSSFVLFFLVLFLSFIFFFSHRELSPRHPSNPSVLDVFSRQCTYGIFGRKLRRFLYRKSIPRGATASVLA